MTTERYSAPGDPAAAMKAGVDALVKSQLRRWMRRWSLGLPLAVAIAVTVPALEWVTWIAVAWASLSLLLVLGMGRFLRRRVGLFGAGPFAGGPFGGARGTPLAPGEADIEIEAREIR